ncbi:hypothetical protein FW774_12920 [Pedobacter sp. BS3]|uniref:glycoside hydrolase family 30 beta sandwich domain-containing protein n=1 Tax=Pedobacter sp. BS3 TaxID=2567937 RepID=UPI0011EBDB90|nr:hypothetical protein FW774_12920 [Pedobacter sp. BS3]
MPNVAFKSPGGRIVLIVLNKSAQPRSVALAIPGNPVIQACLNPGAAGTFVW